MASLDWIVVIVYLIGMAAIALAVGRKHKSREDYFLGGRYFPPSALAASTVATQCSTNSLLGAPAFVGFSVGGGLIWLQYELAVPIAMALLIFVLAPVREAKVTSIYQVLELNLGRRSCLTAAGCFLIFRSIATGVIIYASSLVVSFMFGISFFYSVALLMTVTLLYDLIGGLSAVVISDVVQLILLTTAVVFSIFILGDIINWDFFRTERKHVLVNDWGFSGNDYGFYPMLFGGIFLYMAYYGCDQSQAQRILASRSQNDLQSILFFNGILRFPLVFLYCLLGLGLAALAQKDTTFISALPLLEDGSPNYNLVVPVFVAKYFSEGAVGLVLIGLVAAAMSSVDSSLNSLSAVTLEDFIVPNISEEIEESTLLAYGRICTLFWGFVAIAFSFQVENIAPTVLEAVNKIGSMINGPLFALVCMAVFFKNLGEGRALFGFFFGFLSNVVTAIFIPEISWLWWNVLGFMSAWIAVLLSIGAAKLSSSDSDNHGRVSIKLNLRFQQQSFYTAHVLKLFKVFIFIIIICLVLTLW